MSSDLAESFRHPFGPSLAPVSRLLEFWPTAAQQGNIDGFDASFAFFVENFGATVSTALLSMLFLSFTVFDSPLRAAAAELLLIFIIVCCDSLIALIASL